MKSFAATLGCAASIIALSVATAPSASAATAMTGRVTCGATSDGKFMGMWVSTNGGGDGWASITRTPDNRIAKYTKSGMKSGTTVITIKVGCGQKGTSDWKTTYTGTTTTKSGSGSLSRDWVCGTFYGQKKCL